MATPFETFVNSEMPKRLSTDADPLGVQAGLVPVSTGVGLGVEFKDPAEIGATGKSAYDLAKDNGFTGSLLEYLASLKGEDGEVGPQGPVGILNVLGELGSEELLPDPTGLDNGTAYFIEKHIWLVVEGEWVDGGDISGPKGIDGIGLRILGSFPSTDFLPMVDNESGDCYIIQSKMWVWDTITWSPVGQVGPDGKSAYQIAVQFGFVGTQTQWLNSLKGKDAYQVAVDLGFTGTRTEWVASIKGLKGDQGEKGDKGDRGDPAALVALRGSVANQAALPVGAALGDAYFIGLNVWVWEGDEWFDAGQISGPQGPKGTTGDKGEKGDEGNDAYEIALLEGFVGTRTQWVASLQGDTGLSAYELAQQLGFTGTLAEWIESLTGPQGERGFKGDKGDQGAGLKVVGVVAVVGDLPASGTDYDSYVVGTHLYSWFNAQWNDLGEFVGETGKSAYQHALDSGFSGTLTDWLASLKGLKGDTGLKGDKGDKGNTGDPGLSAYQVAVNAGFSGNQAAWLASLKGADGRSLTVKGELADLAALAAITGQLVGDAYLIPDGIQKDLHVWNGTAWVDLGDITGPQGPDGKSALQFAMENDPSIVDVPTFIASLKGDKGDQGEKGDPGTAFKPKGYLTSVSELAGLPVKEDADTYIVGSGNVYTYSEAIGDFVFMGSIQGPQGNQGPMGPGISILGRKANQSELPGTGTLGQGWLIGLDFWGWTGAAYENLGPVQGPQGEQGIQGDQGLKGDKGDKGNTGDKGDVGTLWIVLGRDPQAIDGRRNDYFLNSATLQYFKKTTEVLWAPLGFLGGGNVYDATFDDKEYSRLNGAWKIIDVLEAPLDGKKYIRIDGAWAELVIAVGEAPSTVDNKQYVRKNGAWAELAVAVAEATQDGKIYGRRNGAWEEIVIPAAGIGEAPNDTKLYGRKSNGWVEIVIPAAGIADAPSDSKQYVRKNGAWVENKFDRYTLKVAATTATLDLAVQQVFTVSASVARTLAFANAPTSAEAMTVVVKVAGNAAAITWPAGIVWSGGAAPVLGATFTVVVLFWDGTQWVGSTGASA